MFPDAKLCIINTSKANNEVVVRIGDGVNDDLALKAFHFGIAVGQKGTEIADSLLHSQAVNMPPSTTWVHPVMYLLSSEAKNKAISASSLDSA
ncbi:ATPase, P-type (transporting), HAD superfamily, subfamily IC [Pricia antarctica]|uniref:ATPase, P-type (Transporting), HAD superfamily, subfamily IC n=1 Tax=Pricia antarctica TaxID=641691 RepID=A0A1G7C7Q3_9FLAO|nr:ATPase, P-type (transporting), HAD superfamily, subfamily IC [Pricia antarctica]